MIELATKGMITQDGLGLVSKGVVFRRVLEKVFREIVRLYSRIVKVIELRSKLGCRKFVS